MKADLLAFAKVSLMVEEKECSMATKMERLMVRQSVEMLVGKKAHQRDSWRVRSLAFGWDMRMAQTDDKMVEL